MAVLAANWPVVVGVAVIALLAAWLLMRRPKTRIRHHAPDALDEGVGPAARNQALIDAPSSLAQMGAAARVASPLASTGPDIFGGIGEVIAVGAAHEVVAAQAGAGAGDDLTRIKGLGPKLAARLAELGVTSFAQIAAWSSEDLAKVDAQLGTFAGRPARDGWVEQAGFLARGDVAGYEAKFGKL